jgi:hypothetical protein
MTTHDPSSRRKTSPTVILIIFLLMSCEWILFVAGVKPHEMLVGTLSVAVATAFMCAVLRSGSLQTHFTLRDVATVWRVPWYILTNTTTLCEVLVKDLFGISSAGSYYCVSTFETSKTDPVLIARSVLATAYTTVSPNSIVIGIDYEQNRMLLHQLKRGELSEMTKQLGAQP